MNIAWVDSGAFNPFNIPEAIAMTFLIAPQISVP